MTATETQHPDVANLAELTTLAAHLRRAFEHGGPWRLPGLARFPDGACGDVAWLVAEYLRSHGHDEWLYVQGSTDYEHYRTHAWLLQDATILDLTADQFRDVSDPVIVTRESPWHRQTWPHQRVHTSNVGLTYYSRDSGAYEDYERLTALLAAQPSPPGSTRGLATS